MTTASTARPVGREPPEVAVTGRSGAQAAGRGAAGMVTAETAVVLPVLLLITFAMAWMVALGVAQVRCLDAAREAVRVAARGDGLAAARAVAERVAPGGAQIGLTPGDGLVRAVVTLRTEPPLPVLGNALAVTLTATATAAQEQSRGNG